jgi:hypothetical protein
MIILMEFLTLFLLTRIIFYTQKDSYLFFADDNKFIWTVIQEKYYKGKIINDNLKFTKVA